MTSALISGFCLLIFAVPAYRGLFLACGWKRALLTIILLNTVGLILETIAIRTGFPYGHFRYADTLGYKILSTTPWSVGLSWSMLIIGATVMVQRFIKGRTFQLAAVVLILIAIDLVLDPGAVALGYWRYAPGLSLYHVPYTNFLGWLLSGTVGTVILFQMLSRRALPASAAGSLLCILIFWTAVDWYKGLIIPGVIGILMTTVTVWVMVSRKG